MAVLKRDSNLFLKVILVGDRSDALVAEATRSLDNCGVDHVLCDSVCSAVGALAREHNQDVLVVGRLRELSRGQGRFFYMANRSGFHCCCLADGDARRMRRDLSVAIRAGAFAISEPAEIEKVIRGLLLLDGVRPWTDQSPPGRIEDESRMTTAELDALLGSHLDE